jgi:serine/threonine protein phosphatase PrpC
MSFFMEETKGRKWMSINMNLFLQNVHAALANQQSKHAMFLVDYAMKLAQSEECLPSLSPLDVSIGLHPGRVRGVNEDCAFAINGLLPGAQRFGLYMVCDGMGGHVRGLEAANLAVETIVEYVLPFIGEHTTYCQWERLLVEGIQQANRAIYLRNQSLEQQSVVKKVPVSTSQIHHMGTTITAVLLFDETAYVANVGDSRTYLYNHSLRRITRDHSLVAQYLADGILEEEEIYLHPQRNQITRALGIKDTVGVDTFVVPLHGNEILLLCTDGLWEMTRDRKIEDVLASPCASASSMVNRLVQMANDGGGTDNIGCIVIQLQRRTDLSAMETMCLEPVAALNRLVSLS